MSNFVRYSRILTERGTRKIEESKEHIKKGEHEAAAEKYSQGAQDILTVAKYAAIANEILRDGLKIEADGLALEIRELTHGLKRFMKFKPL